jgi:DNA-3-methyladenine glycosylase I
VDPGTDGVRIGADGRPMCWWSVGEPLNQMHHDLEWGRPVAEDRSIFETLCLEGFQSGLSWLTIMRKRENFRQAFASFDMEALSRFDAHDVDRLLGDPGIVRHRGKIEATLNNARRCLELVQEVGSLAAHVWSFEPKSEPHAGPFDWVAISQLGVIPEAKALSKDLKRRGWSFVGPTTVQSALESIGVVDHHVEACALREEIEAERAAFVRPRPQTQR